MNFVDPDLNTSDIFALHATKSSSSMDLEDLSRDDERLRGLQFRPIGTREDGLQYQRNFSSLPEKYFVQVRFACKIDGIECVVVEKNSAAKLPLPKEKRIDAIRHIIEMALVLDKYGIIHGNLKKESLVEVNGALKFCSAPVSISKDNIDLCSNQSLLQPKQLCDIVDSFFETTEVQEPAHRNFTKYLSKSNTMVDLHSMLQHPYLKSVDELPFYYLNCHLIQKGCHITLSMYNGIFKVKPFMYSGKFKTQSWKDIIKNEAHRDIGSMLMKRKVNNFVKEYGDGVFDLHVFFWNVFRHFNDKRVTLWSVDEIHLEFQRLFPKYVRRMFKFMHRYALNSHFSPRNDVPQSLKYAIPIEKDGQLFIPHVLQTSKYIHYLLVRFRSICTRNPAVLLVKVVAKELVASVMKVQKIEESVYRCATTDIRTMSEMDKAVLQLLRIIHGALHFAHLVATNKLSTMFCIAKATQLTADEFAPYYGTGTQAFGVGYEAKINGIIWPDLDDVQRLVGGKFVVNQTRWTEIMRQAVTLAGDLVGLLQGLEQDKLLKTKHTRKAIK